jgi:hypothetical protein
VKIAYLPGQAKAPQVSLGGAMLRHRPITAVRISGHAGSWIFEPAIKEVIVINPPKSHKDGPNFSQRATRLVVIPGSTILSPLSSPTAARRSPGSS